MKSPQNRELILKEITASDMNKAEIVWINYVQSSSFETELKYLTRVKPKDDNLAIRKFVEQFTFTRYHSLWWKNWQQFFDVKLETSHFASFRKITS